MSVIRYKFLLHGVSHRIFVVEITAVDLGWDVDQIFNHSVPVAVFRGLDSARSYFRFLGADEPTIEQAFQSLLSRGVAVLQIISRS
jgi:hypothetical protein